MITKKDIERLACGLREAQPAVSEYAAAAAFEAALNQWRLDILMIVEVVEASNTRFDRKRFKKAVGYYL